jgi:hypothetical protein
VALSPYEGHDLETLRDTLSRVIMPSARRAPFFTLHCPLAMWDLELRDDAAITHYGGYDAGAAGWGSRIFERRHVDVADIIESPGEMGGELAIRFRDVRGSLLRSEWDPGSVAVFSDQMQLGRARALSAGSCWFRSSSKWIDDPAGGRIVEVRRHVPSLTSKGLLVERYAENIIRSSAMQTALGSPWFDGGGTATDASFLLWDSSLATQNYTVTGNTAADKFFYQDLVFGTAPANGDILELSIDHFDVDGVAPSFALDDNTAAKNWRASDNTWVAGGQRGIWNALTLHSSGSGRDSFMVTMAAANAPRLSIGFPAGAGNNNKKARFFSAVFEWGRSKAKQPWASSRILTPSGASVARSSDCYIWDDPSGLRTINASQGTILWRFTPLWSSANLASLGLTFEIFRVVYDANNRFSVFYQGDNARWRCQRRQGGANTNLDTNKAIVAGTTYTGAMRWASSNGELGDLYGANASGKTWFDVILDGVRSPGVESTPPAESAAAVVYVGGLEGQQIDGMLQIEHVPWVLSETEVARWVA